MTSAAFSAEVRANCLSKKFREFAPFGVAVAALGQNDVARQIGQNPARIDAGDRNPALSQLMAERVGKAANGEFGGVIGRLRRNPDQAIHAGDIDDMPLPFLQKMMEKGFRAIDHAPKN